VLHREIQNSELPGHTRCRCICLINSYLSMSQLQMNVQVIENTAGHQKESDLTRTSLLNEVSDGQSFLHIRSMVSSLGILNTAPFHKNYSRISSKISFCRSATHSPGHDRLLSWIMLQFISLRYIKMLGHY